MMHWKRTGRQKVQDVLSRGGWHTTKQISQRTGMSRSSVHDILVHMVSMGLVERQSQESKGYGKGPASNTHEYRAKKETA